MARVRSEAEKYLANGERQFGLSQQCMAVPVKLPDCDLRHDRQARVVRG
jgi:hypothetical protein